MAFNALLALAVISRASIVYQRWRRVRAGVVAVSVLLPTSFSQSLSSLTCPDYIEAMQGSEALRCGGVTRYVVRRYVCHSLVRRV